MRNLLVRAKIIIPGLYLFLNLLAWIFQSEAFIFLLLLPFGVILTWVERLVGFEAGLFTGNTFILILVGTMVLFAVGVVWDRSLSYLRTLPDWS